jgi:GT2 family glycosyltransferase
MPGISVAMAYYNRPELLRNTLWAYRHLHEDIADYEFIIVDDRSDPGLEAEPVVEEMRDALDVKLIYSSNKVGVNPARPVNISVREARGDVVVITNPETLPVTPVLHSLKAITPQLAGSYVVSPCYSVSREKQRIIDALDPTSPTFVESIAARIELLPRPATEDGGDGWYEHPTFIFRGLYFFGAITKADFVSMGGMDEDFQAGYAWEDTDFIRRLQARRVRFGYLDSVCLHQNHYSAPASKKHPGGFKQDNRVVCEQKAAAGVLVANIGREWGRL